MECRKITLTDKDLKILQYQLKREPRGVKEIASRCDYGYPEVIENESIIEGKPFPTIFWLTCPLKIKTISRLEGQGWSDHVKSYLAENPDKLEELEFAHKQYRKRRLQQLSQSNPALATGIGGVHDTGGIKCLHAHYAHFLGMNCNPIGEIISRTLGKIECSNRCDDK